MHRLYVPSKPVEIAAEKLVVEKAHGWVQNMPPRCKFNLKNLEKRVVTKGGWYIHRTHSSEHVSFIIEILLKRAKRKIKKLILVIPDTKERIRFPRKLEHP